jgi:hypothetical protein
METNICKVYEHIFSVDKDGVLKCEKCNKTYMQYMDQIEEHLKGYRKF